MLRPRAPGRGKNASGLRLGGRREAFPECSECYLFSATECLPKAAPMVLSNFASNWWELDTFYTYFGGP